MNYFKATSFAAVLELARLRKENYKCYMLQMRDESFEIRYWL